MSLTWHNQSDLYLTNVHAQRRRHLRRWRQRVRDACWRLRWPGGEFLP